MMPGYGNGMGAWGWMAMSLGTLLFVALIAVVVWVLVRSTRSGSRPIPSGDSAREILDQRYASGEIDEAEYRQRLATLRGGTTVTR